MGQQLEAGTLPGPDVAILIQVTRQAVDATYRAHAQDGKVKVCVQPDH